MGLGIDFEFNHCGHCGRSDHFDSLYITYNLSEMATKAGSILFDCGDTLSAKEALADATRTLSVLRKNQQRFEKMNPKNGWGSYCSLVKTLEKLRCLCEEHQDGKLIFSR